jgi:hypothetical protein
MVDSPNKSELLKRIRKSREKLDSQLENLDPVQKTVPGVSGDWSVKDILAHITWHEREMLKVIHVRALAGSDLWDLPLDQRNAAIFEENKDRALKDVLEEYSTVFAELITAIDRLADGDLHDAGHFAQMPSDWNPWELFADNTYLHYEDHLIDLKAWRKKTKLR